MAGGTGWEKLSGSVLTLIDAFLMCPDDDSNRALVREGALGR